jgi:hypothetical protein
LEGAEKKHHSVLILTLWILWNRRNAIIFRDNRASVEATFSEIRGMAQQWALAGCVALKPLFVVNDSSE